jgi:predicted nucleotidyltransferase
VSAPASPFAEALVALARAGVDFVVVGVAGINFYARDASGVVLTADLDLLLAPRVDVLRAALAALARAGFAFEAGGEPFVDLEDDSVLGRWIERAASLAALGPEGARVDLMLSVKGYRFDELAGDAERFRIGGLEIRVGRLEKLLRAKELSDRPKDREFLRLFAARLRDDVEGSE